MCRNYLHSRKGRVPQSVTCLATDASLTADPGVASSIPARSHTFVDIDHEIISTVILLPSAESFKKGCCQLQAKVCARSTGELLVQACQGKSVVRSTDRPAMTIAVDLGHKVTKQTNKQSRKSENLLNQNRYVSQLMRFWYGRIQRSGGMGSGPPPPWKITSGYMFLVLIIHVIWYGPPFRQCYKSQYIM